MDLKRLGTLFIEASKVAEENKVLKYELERLKRAMYKSNSIYYESK